MRSFFVNWAKRHPHLGARFVYSCGMHEPIDNDAGFAINGKTMYAAAALLVVIVLAWSIITRLIERKTVYTPMPAPPWASNATGPVARQTAAVSTPDSTVAETSGRFRPNLIDVGSIRGVVLDAQGARVPNVEVTLSRRASVPHQRAPSSSVVVNTRSGPHGEFAFQHIPVPSDSQWPRYDETFALRAETSTTFAYAEVALDRINRWVSDDLVLRPRGVLAGTVVDETGAPIAGAVAMIRRSPDSQSYWGQCLPVITQADGRFLFNSLLPGNNLVVAGARGFTEESLASVAIGSPDVKIVLKKGASINGTLIDEATQHAVSGIIVRLWKTGKGATPDTFTREISDTCDPNGHFRIEGLTAGTYEVGLTQPTLAGAQPLPSRPHTIDVKNGEALSNISVAVLPVGGCRGKVYEKSSKVPLAAARVIATPADESIYPARVPVDERGEFEFTALADGLWRIGILQASRRPFDDVPRRVVEVRAGQMAEDVDFAVEREYQLSGVVVSAAGQPSANASVFAKTNVDIPDPCVQTKGDGRFTIQFADAASGVRLQALDDTGISLIAGPFTAGTREGRPIELQVQPACGISGEVVTREQKPISNARVCLSPDSKDKNVIWPIGSENSELGPEARTGQSGTFSLSPLLPGSYLLEVFAIAEPLDILVASQNIVLAPGQKISDLHIIAKTL